ncbi:hypothetical protein D9619_000982 [Psilocybe cf. subviscida]|uniref:DUF788-domain-containing protein n=1 Tax=Psilocybe cf. subviscida TaxID=2480587 RepID=A0A8H5BFQ4_9AGAR|nr:hypothetical protein D9619_000982 [Psilocybe cf. subviscida]
MANASGKRIASQNDATIKILRFGMFVPTLLSFLFRLLLRRSSLPPSKGSLAIYLVTFLPALFLNNYLVKIGTPRRDPTTGTLISQGEDLSQPGVTEWCFDILYITWVCQMGSGAFGEWFWWFYMIIPLYAVFKLWSSVISPMFLGGGQPSAPTNDAADKEGAPSKRQEKLRKRQEKGDPRVKVQTRK